MGVEPESSWTVFAPSYRKDVVNPPTDFVARRPTNFLLASIKSASLHKNGISVDQAISCRLAEKTRRSASWLWIYGIAILAEVEIAPEETGVASDDGIVFLHDANAAGQAVA